jgi:uncharacterized protein involved in oxidation of intracellular sulfur
MKLSIVLTTTRAETNWNALRLANLALKKEDEVSIFLLGEAVEYEAGNNDKYNIKQQVDTFLQSSKAKIIACGTCMKLRHQESTKTCPVGGLEDFYSLVATSDKVLIF